MKKRKKNPLHNSQPQTTFTVFLLSRKTENFTQSSLKKNKHNKERGRKKKYYYYKQIAT